MVRPRMPLIAVRANSEEGVFEAKAERNNSTLIIKWAPFIWARWGAPSRELGQIEGAFIPNAIEFDRHLQ